MTQQDDNWPRSQHPPPSLDRFSLHRCPERRKITNLWKKRGKILATYKNSICIHFFDTIKEGERNIEIDLHSLYDPTSRCIFFRDILLILTLVQPISPSLPLESRSDCTSNLMARRSTSARTPDRGARVLQACKLRRRHATLHRSSLVGWKRRRRVGERGGM